MESVVAAGGAPRGRPPRDRRLDRLRLARDLHAGARRQRRPPRSTPCVRRSAPTPTRSSSPTPRASPATRWAPASRTSWPSRRSRPASCRRCRTSRSPTPSSASSTCRRAAPTRCVTRCGWRPASARRSPCRCCAGPRCPTVAHRVAERARLRLPDRRPGGLAALAGLGRAARRTRARGRRSAAARRRQLAPAESAPAPAPAPGTGAGSSQPSCAAPAAVVVRAAGGRAGRRPAVAVPAIGRVPASTR